MVLEIPEYVKIQPPVLTGDQATDRKNYIETCFKIDFEAAPRRKSVMVNDNCDVVNGQCDIAGLTPGEQIPLDPVESESTDYVYAWDKCGESETFDMTSDPEDIIGHVDKQIEELKLSRENAVAGLASARKKRRY